MLLSCSWIPLPTLDCCTEITNKCLLCLKDIYWEFLLFLGIQYWYINIYWESQIVELNWSHYLILGRRCLTKSTMLSPNTYITLVYQLQHLCDGSTWLMQVIFWGQTRIAFSVHPDLYHARYFFLILLLSTWICEFEYIIFGLSYKRPKNTEHVLQLFLHFLWFSQSPSYPQASPPSCQEVQVIGGMRGLLITK